MLESGGRFPLGAPMPDLRLVLSLAVASFASPAFAAGTAAVAGVPIEFILFALTLLGVALFHGHTLAVALSGLTAISLYKIAFTGFKTGEGVSGWIAHLGHEWVILTNLFCLLMGFALLARHVEKSHVPVVLPRFLPDDWKGGFVLLVMVWFISSFLDNIAAALIGGAMAHQLFRAKVHIGYLAAIVAASNAGGAWSVDAWWAARKGRAEAEEWQVGWNLRLVGLVTTLSYLLAGVAKLVSDPQGWTSGKSLLGQIGNDGLYKDLVSSKGATEWVPYLYQHPSLLLVAAVGTLVLEVGAPLALLDRRLGWLWSVGIWSMHRGIQMIMGIVFPYPLSGVAFVSFFPVERGVEWLRTTWKRRLPVRPERSPSP